MRATDHPEGTAIRACLSVVESIEDANQTEEDLLQWLVEDALEMKADTTGAMQIVITTGGPHIEVELGDGNPRVVAYWGGDRHWAPVNIDETIVEAVLDTFWRPTMEAALLEEH